jgi:hypothetical protein
MPASQTMPRQRIWNGEQTVHLIQRDDGFELTRVSLEDVPLVMSKFRVEIRSLERTLRKKWPRVRSVSIEKQLPVMKNPHVPGAVPISPGHLVLVIAYLSYKAGRSRERLRKDRKSFTQAAGDAAGKKVGDNLGNKINVFVNLWLDRRLETLQRKYERQLAGRRRKQKK